MAVMIHCTQNSIHKCFESIDSNRIGSIITTQIYKMTSHDFLKINVQLVLLRLLLYHTFNSNSVFKNIEFTSFYGLNSQSMIFPRIYKYQVL